MSARSALLIVAALYVTLSSCHLYQSTDTLLNATRALSKRETEDDNQINPICDLLTGIQYTPYADTVASQSVKVESTSGRIEGLESTLFGKQLYSFLGIPYAAAPIGDLRFRRTVSVEPWEGTLKATRFRPHCAQFIFKSLLQTINLLSLDLSEDCLYLNIWTPSLGKTSDSLKPVMIWVHGGGFNMGSVAMEESVGDVLATYGDVVVVTFSQRVGAFGFMDLGVDEAPGNQQIYDEREALRWVKNNIRSFGGDPDQMTVFCQSSGAMNTGLLMMNPVGEKLFNRVILQSGAPTFFGVFYEQGSQTIKQLLKLLSCPFEDDVDSFDILDCLQNKTTADIIIAQKEILDKQATTFTPSANEAIAPLMPQDLMNREETSQIFSEIDSVLIGTNRDEASYILHVVLPDIFTMDGVKLNITSLEELREFIVSAASKFVDVPGGQIRVLVNTFFGGNEVNTTANLVKKLYDFAGDMAFLCPAKAFADELLKEKKQVHFYQFAHRPKWDTRGQWMGSHHNTEIPFVFGLPLKKPQTYDGVDIEMSKRLMKIWSHFARTGETLPQFGLNWSEYSAENQAYMELKPNEAKMGYKLHESTCKLYTLGVELVN